MIRFSRQDITKALSVGTMLMGIVHIAATFTPLIADKLILLPYSSQDAFTYFSLMCGLLLILGGGVTYTLTELVVEYEFAQEPYMFTLAILNADGILAVCFMPHNPCAWIILVLATGMMFANATRYLE